MEYPTRIDQIMIYFLLSDTAKNGLTINKSRDSVKFGHIDVIWLTALKSSGHGYLALSRLAASYKISNSCQNGDDFQIFLDFCKIFLLQCRIFTGIFSFMIFEIYPIKNNQNSIFSEVFHTKNSTFYLRN